MFGIAGVENGGKKEVVEKMLSLIAHRGRMKPAVDEHDQATLGKVGSGKNGASKRGFAGFNGRVPSMDDLQKEHLPFADAWVDGDSLMIARDKVGVSPLYYGYDEAGKFCYASEVKALMATTSDIHEFPPGYLYRSMAGFQPFGSIRVREKTNESPETIAKTLRSKLETSIKNRVDSDVLGSWLSGGID